MSSRYKTNYIKTCSFLYERFSEAIKVVANLLRKAYGETLDYWKDICVGTHWNYLYEAIPMCTNNICY